MSSDWEFSRLTGRCAVTGREFAEGELYFTALFETAEGLERRDYTPDAWSGPPEGSICHWQARVPMRDKTPQPLAVDQELLTSLFLRLEDDASEVRQQFRFVLALLLMRKRRLRFEGTVRETDQEFWRLRLVTDQSEHRVLNPRLTDEHIERLSTQLTAILSGDVEAVGMLAGQDEE